jgi:hypothetical protein
MSFFGNNSLLASLKSLLDWRLIGPSYWPAYSQSIQRTIATRTVADTFFVPNVAFPGGSTGFVGGVLLPDGRVFCTPRSSTTARIYNPATDTLTTPNATYPGSAFSSVLLHDGRVYSMPWIGGVTARIYNPVSDISTLSQTPHPISTNPSFSNFIGAVVLPDGRVFCVPHGSTSARIYNPTTDSLTTPNGTYPGNGTFTGGVLLPDGRVLCVPNIGTSARIYDPATDTLTTPSGTYSGGSFLGGVLLPDGRVFCVPFNSTSARIYNPNTNTLVASATFSPSPSDTSPFFQGGVLLSDGKVFCVPRGSTTALIYGGGGGFDINVSLSSYYNKF